VNDARRLAGNGAELVRERALAAKVQGALERVYQLDRVADVGDFLHGAEAGERETLLLREANDGTLEMRLRLPLLGQRAADSTGTSAVQDKDGADLDAVCQIIEGVSHFVYVVDRACTQRGATQLELELQAEVDKWVVLAGSMRPFGVERSELLRSRLYECVSFEHDEESEVGERYRVANEAAHRFVRRLEREYVGQARYGEMRSELRRFFRVGQEEKLRLGRAFQ
jgi:hypothetical protein